MASIRSSATLRPASMPPCCAALHHLVLLLMLVPLLPESPRYLLVKGRTEQAKAVLGRIAHACRTSLPDGHLASISATSLEAAGAVSNATDKRLCGAQLHRRVQSLFDVLHHMPVHVCVCVCACACTCARARACLLACV